MTPTSKRLVDTEQSDPKLRYELPMYHPLRGTVQEANNDRWFLRIIWSDGSDFCQEEIATNQQPPPVAVPFLLLVVRFCSIRPCKK